MLKKTLSLAAVALALAASPAAATELFVKKGVSLNCRVGPSSSHHVVKVLHPAQSVKLIDHHAGWAQVRAHHAVCWAAKSYLTDDLHKHHAPKKAAPKKVHKPAPKKHKPAPKCHHKPIIILNVDYDHHGPFNVGPCSHYGMGKIEPKKHVQKVSPKW